MIAIHIQNNITLDKKLLRIKRINAAGYGLQRNKLPKSFITKKELGCFSRSKREFILIPNGAFGIPFCSLARRWTIPQHRVGQSHFRSLSRLFLFLSESTQQRPAAFIGDWASDAGIKQGLEELSADLHHDQYSEAVADEQCSLRVMSGNQFIDNFTTELRELLESASVKVRQLVIVQSK